MYVCMYVCMYNVLWQQCRYRRRPGGVLFARQLQPALLLESLFRGKQELNNHVRMSMTLLIEEECLWNVIDSKNMLDMPHPPRVYPQSSTTSQGSPRTLGVTCSPLTSWATRPGRRRTRRLRRKRRRWRWRRGRCWSWSRQLRVELLWTRSLVSEWAFWKLKHRIKTSHFLLSDAMF